MNFRKGVSEMKNCKLSIMNSIIAGILLCGMLAACGVAEKRYSAPEEPKAAEVIDMNIPDHIISSRAKNQIR